MFSFSQLSINSIQIVSSVYGVKVYAPTSICSKSGGMCVHRDDCAKGQFALKSGMCGYNDKNVECCFEGKFKMYFFGVQKVCSSVLCRAFSGTSPLSGFFRDSSRQEIVFYSKFLFNVLDRMEPNIVILWISNIKNWIREIGFPKFIRLSLGKQAIRIDI